MRRAQFGVGLVFAGMALGCATEKEPISLLDGKPVRRVEQPSGWREHEENYYERTRNLYGPEYEPYFRR